MPYHFYTSELVDIIDVTPQVKRFFFRMLELTEFKFSAGQFVMLDLPIQSKITTRSYSIASAPGGNTIELIVSLNDSGLGTPFLFNSLKKGFQLPLSQPAGKFMQPPATNLETDVCLVCTGTGIAPFRAYLRDMVNRNVSHKNIDLIFGTRYEKDILYRSEMEELHKNLSGFRFVPVLSRETGTWQGEKGYVHQVYERLYAGKQPAIFYLCGWKVMIKEARERLLKMGYDKSRIKFELYD
ncbi:MAG: FAD-dependent oxidoreductase [Bacteroidia bacterium]|nr:FAD-dependent oxidoreductase [Bacteroidia bacterium]